MFELVSICFVYALFEWLISSFVTPPLPDKWCLDAETNACKKLTTDLVLHTKQHVSPDGFICTWREWKMKHSRTWSRKVNPFADPVAIFLDRSTTFLAPYSIAVALCQHSPHKKFAVWSQQPRTRFETWFTGSCVYHLDLKLCISYSSCTSRTPNVQILPSHFKC